MQVSPLKAAVIGFVAAGVIGLLYVVFSAFGTGPQGSVADYATGEMSGFIVLDEAPSQSRQTFVDPDGEEFTLADYHGQVVLLNLWASWCAPCVEEMPALDRLQADMGGEEFEVVTISLDRSMADAEGFFQRAQLENLPLLHADFSLADDVGVRALPLTVLYDRRGAEIGRVNGEAHWDHRDAKRLIQAAIDSY
jgi:thiol-disulfide isomerase/thioredoxin